MDYKVTDDSRALVAWIEEVGDKRARSTAATVLTSLMRSGRREGLTELRAQTKLPARQVSRRAREFRANPADEPMVAGVYLNPYQIREVLLAPRQTGHPGRPRKSRSKSAVAARKWRASRGARPPRKGGVKSAGRTLPGAWIGTKRKGRGAGDPNVLERRGDKVARVFREWQMADNVFLAKLNRAAKEWPAAYAKALQRAINRRARR